MATIKTSTKRREKLVRQAYPRCAESDLLVVSGAGAIKKLTQKRMIELCKEAIEEADMKSTPDPFYPVHKGKTNKGSPITDKEGKEAFYKRTARELVQGLLERDPSLLPYEIADRKPADICRDLVRERRRHARQMNAGWRYQKLLLRCAREQKLRFESAADSGTKQDIVATLHGNVDEIKNLQLWVSVKAKSTTTTGSLWPQEIEKLENAAKKDKNRSSSHPYCCIVGLALEKCERFQKKRDKAVVSPNSEVWGADFLWEFFSGMKYEKVLECMSLALKDNHLHTGAIIDPALIRHFKKECQAKKMISENGTVLPADRLLKVLSR